MDSFQQLALKTLNAELMRLRTLQIEHPTAARESLIAAHQRGIDALKAGREPSLEKINGERLQRIIDTQIVEK